MIKRLIFHLFLVGVMFFLLDEYLLVGKFVVTGGWKGYALVTLIFSFVMTIVRPVVRTITAPISFLTLGLFSFLINAAMIWCMEQLLHILDLGVTVELSDWTMYVIVGFVMAFVNVLIP